MTFRVRIGGVEVECDSAEEALALAKGMGSTSTSASTNALPKTQTLVSNQTGEATAADLAAAASKMTAAQRAFLRGLKQRGRADITELVALMPGEATSQSLSGSIVGVIRSLKSAGILKERVFRNEVTGSYPSRKSTYIAGPLLVAAEI